MSRRVPSAESRRRVETEAIGKADEASYLVVQIRGSVSDRSAYMRYARGQLIATDHLFPDVGVGHIPIHPPTERAGRRLPPMAHAALAALYTRMIRYFLDQTPTPSVVLHSVPDPTDKDQS